MYNNAWNGIINAHSSGGCGLHAHSDGPRIKYVLITIAPKGRLSSRPRDTRTRC